jgi:glucuronokinase
VRSATALAYARAGLLGNPSDIYGGRVLAFTFTDFTARTSLSEAPRIEIGDGLVAEALRDAVAPGVARRCQGATALMAAAVTKLADHAPHLIDEAPGFCLRVSSDIPRQAGLAGSSAIVIAALRALAARFALDLDAPTLAGLALAAETEVLGITAGPMDRVVQAHEGLLYMDFRPGGVSTRLDPTRLPPALLAWNPMPGEQSGTVHARVRARWERGEPQVVEAVAELASLADEGLGALRAGDVERLRQLIERSIAVRAAVWTLAEGDRDMIEIGRSAGVPMKLCGSGGAVVGVARDAAEFAPLEAAYRRAGYRTLRPRVVP